MNTSEERGRSFRVLVCGGRDFRDRAKLVEVLDRLDRRYQFTAVIHGAATGADQDAHVWATSRGKVPMPFPAPWDDLTIEPCVVRSRRDGTKYNAAAGPYRNQKMLDEGEPDLVVAFPGGSGTRDMVKRANGAGLPVHHVSEDDEILVTHAKERP